MTRSKNTTTKKTTENPKTEAEELSPVTGTVSAAKATAPAVSPAGKRRVAPIAARRAPIHYTPRIPSAHCPTC